MGKYIIDVDESEIVECWNEQAVKEIGYQEYALKKCPEIKVKIYNPTGDIISRDALKKAIEEVEDNYDGYEPNDLGKFMNKVYDLIGNAPPVDLWQMRQEATENALKKAEVLYGRPKGEWVYRQEWFEGEKEPRMAWGCNQCGFSIKSVHEKRNFCPNCGADMKGGAE